VGKLIERRKADPETGEVRVLQRFKQTNFLGKVRMDLSYDAAFRSVNLRFFREALLRCTL
jgi:hypothetical protein